MNLISRPTAKDLLLICLVAVIWGSAPVVTKILVRDVSPLWTATARVVLGFLVLLPFCVKREFQWPQNSRTWVFICIVSIFNIVIPFMLISWGLQFIGAGVTGLLLGSTPLIALVMNHFYTSDDRINRYKILAALLGLAGILVVMGEEALFDFDYSTLLAQLAVIASGTCYVFAGLFMRRVNMRPVPFTSIALGIGAMVLLIISLSVEGFPDHAPNRAGWIALLWLGTLPTTLGYLLRFYLVHRIGVTTFSIGMNIVPVFGIVIAAIVLGEVINSTTMIALGLVIAGLLVSRAGVPANPGGQNKATAKID